MMTKKPDPFPVLPRRPMFTEAGPSLPAEPLDRGVEAREDETPAPRSHPKPRPEIMRVKGEAVTVRLQPRLLARLDRYRRGLTRPQAIRALLFEHLP